MQELESVKEELIQELLPKDDVDDRGAIVEIRAGTGGDEAGLFASEVFGMYERYADLKGWSFSVLSMHRAGVTADAVAVREAAVTLSTPGAFGAMKHESGIHRVQVRGRCLPWSPSAVCQTGRAVLGELMVFRACCVRAAAHSSH